MSWAFLLADFLIKLQYHPISHKGKSMERRDKTLKVIANNEEEFLNLLKGKKIYCYRTHYTDSTSPVLLCIGAFLKDGHTLYLYQKKLLLFYHRFSPNEILYQSPLNKHFYVHILHKDDDFFISYNPPKTKSQIIFLKPHHLFDLTKTPISID